FSEREIGSGITDVDRACAGVSPHSFERADQENFPRQVHHDARETFGGAVHDPPHEADEADPKNENDDEDAGGDFDPASGMLGFLCGGLGCCAHKLRHSLCPTWETIPVYGICKLAGVKSLSHPLSANRFGMTPTLQSYSLASSMLLITIAVDPPR